MTSKKLTKAELAAAPQYGRGEVVAYSDHHDRLQTGAVRSIDAHWPGYSDCGKAPYFIYRVDHPSYRNRQAYVSEGNILRRVPGRLAIKAGEAE